MKRAIITGITGQDGSYLAELLLSKDYEVHGIIRRSSSFNTSRIDHIYQDPHEKDRCMILHYGDLTDSSSINRIIEKVEPEEIYNLGAQSHVKVSFDLPEYTALVDGVGALRILDCIRDKSFDTRFYQAGTSELYGNINIYPQDEDTPFQPASPYACAKAYAHYVTECYRKSYGLFATNGILFNHESPRRKETFVSKKISSAVARIKKGSKEKLYLGNLGSVRDWGYAPEYVQGMWQMLQHKRADDFVLATGISHTVREFAQKAFEIAGFDIRFEGEGKDEKALDNESGRVLLEVDQAYYRPQDVEKLMGNPAKAKRELGWKAKTTFEDLVRIMVEADLKDGI